MKILFSFVLLSFCISVWNPFSIKTESANTPGRLIDQLTDLLLNKDKAPKKKSQALRKKQVVLPSVTKSPSDKLDSVNKSPSTKHKPSSRSHTNRVRKKQSIKHGSCTVELKINGVIGAVTLDILDQAIHSVRKQNCSSLLLLINTPGGQLISTRKIVNRILNVKFPVLCLIYPAGARAGSAGAIIMQACHINGAIETTNIGAATPIMGTGQKISDDLRKKLINDTTSWLDSLTNLRKRNRKFGREIVTEAKAVSATGARKINAIDFVGKTKEEFLQFAHGQVTTVKEGKTHTVQVGPLIPLPLGIRYHVISLLTEPEFIYILFTGSLFLLYYEITHPGLGAPGILGVMGLIIAFMGMHKLAFSWAGLMLLLLSLVLFLAEVFIAGFGIFGSAGAVAFLLGSFLIFDPSKTGGVDIPISMILSVSFIFTLLMGLTAWLAWSVLRIKKTSSISDDFLNQTDSLAEVVAINEAGTSGMVFINGENWRFQSSLPVKKGDSVKVLCYKGLVLNVQPIEHKTKEVNKPQSI